MQDAKDERELAELISVYKSQENELFELRARLARFMTKGAPLLPLATPSARAGKQASAAAAIAAKNKLPKTRR